MINSGFLLSLVYNTTCLTFLSKKFRYNLWLHPIFDNFHLIQLLLFVRYVLEVITYIAVALVFVVYTEKFYVLPVLLKTVVTIITWINVKRVYSSSFGTFYTKETEAIIYWKSINFLKKQYLLLGNMVLTRNFIHITQVCSN